MNPINSTMIAPALTSIGRDLGVGTAATLWLVAAMYLASAVGQPVAGRLVDLVGARRVFLAGAVLVTAAGLVGALAPSLAVLVGARVLVGLGTAAAYPSALTMIRDRAEALSLPAPERALGALTASSLVTLAVGPPLGGVLVELVGWRSTFAVNIGLGLLTLLLSVGRLPSDRPRARASDWVRGLDLPGMVLFSTSLTLLLLFLVGLPLPGWPLLAGALVAALGLAVVELRTREPFLDLRMLAANRPLAGTYLRLVLTFVLIYGVLFGYTQWLEQVRGLSPAASGLVMLALSGVGAVLALAGSRRRSVRGPLIIGTAGLLGGSLALLALHGEAAPAALVLVAALFGLPHGLNAVANQVAVYRQAPAELGTASGLARTAQYIGAVLASTTVAVAFGDQASDPGLDVLAVVFTGLAVVLLALTGLDRGLSVRRPARPGA
jgi:MFS family permease